MRACVMRMTSLYLVSLQLKDIGSGNFGVAKLMRYKPTGELVAVKFIERGDKVQPLPCLPLNPPSGLLQWGYALRLASAGIMSRGDFDTITPAMCCCMALAVHSASVSS